MPAETTRDPEHFEPSKHAETSPTPNLGGGLADAFGRITMGDGYDAHKEQQRRQAEVQHDAFVRKTEADALTAERVAKNTRIKDSFGTAITCAVAVFIIVCILAVCGWIVKGVML